MLLCFQPSLRVNFLHEPPEESEGNLEKSQVVHRKQIFVR